MKPSTRRIAVLIRRVVALFAEINYAQHKLDAIRTNSDSYLSDADRGPADYAEFLFRTAGVLLHEPAATRRARGQVTR